MTLAAVLLSTFLNFSGITFAADVYNITEGSFPVRDILKLPGDDQPQEYFNAKDKAPIEAFGITIINYALAIMGSIAVILIIFAGFRMMVADGESQKIDEAKEIIKYAIMGLIFAFLSYLIVIFVQSLFPAT